MKKEMNYNMKLCIIHCNTGCTCCSDENHIRGFYKSKEDAEKRVAYFKSPDSKFWPVASQYASRGSYYIEEVDVEIISNNRVVLDNSVYNLNVVELNEDGSLSDNKSERLD